MKTISLTPRETEVLLLILGVDMDALGLDRRSQLVVQKIRNKLMESQR